MLKPLAYFQGRAAADFGLTDNPYLHTDLQKALAWRAGYEDRLNPWIPVKADEDITMVRGPDEIWRVT